jgi:hypothetical protein
MLGIKRMPLSQAADRLDQPGIDLLVGVEKPFADGAEKRNPLRANLVERAEDWRYGSLWRWAQTVEPLPNPPGTLLARSLPLTAIISICCCSLVPAFRGATACDAVFRYVS